jgi:hypothetical protein
MDICCNNSALATYTELSQWRDTYPCVSYEGMYALEAHLHSELGSGVVSFTPRPIYLPLRKELALCVDVIVEKETILPLPATKLRIYYPGESKKFLGSLKCPG